MRYYISTISVLIFCSISFCDEAEIKAIITRANKAYAEAKTEKDYEAKSKIFETIKSDVNSGIEKLAKSGRIYTDEELAPLNFVRAQCCFHLREYREALADYQTMADAFPNHPRAWAKIALIRASAPDEKLRDSKAAIIASEKAIKALELAAENAQKGSDLEQLQKAFWLEEIRQEVVEAVASSQAASGNYKEAITMIKKLDDKNVSAKEQLELYRTGKPNRLPEKSK